MITVMEVGINQYFSDIKVNVLFLYSSSIMVSKNLPLCIYIFNASESVDI